MFSANDVVAFSATLTKDKQLVHGEVVEFDDITRNDGQSYTDICGTFRGTLHLLKKQDLIKLN